MTAKSKAAKIIGEENSHILELLEKNGFVVKEKHIHRTHQTNRYPAEEKEVIGKVVGRDDNVTYDFVDKDSNGFEIITNSNGKYIFSQWVSNQNYIEVTD